MSDLTESGAVLGDPCEAIEAMFVYGPQRCHRRSVAFAIDSEWGTTHVVCAEHTPTQLAQDPALTRRAGNDEPEEGEHG